MMMASHSIPAKDAECESIAVPNWLQLPRDITANILQRLDTIEIVRSACQVCPQWWNICKDPLMWRTIRMIDDLDTPDDDLVEICRYAIERSSGHLEIIEIESFCTDDLLECIAKNAINLRCLKLANCHRILERSFCEAVRNFPQLEVLDISECVLSTESLKVVGLSCPLLKVLKLARSPIQYRVYDVDDDEAFVIAKTMSGLSHLNIIGNELSNVGLLAILDGCPLLQALDIRRCYNLNLSESLRKRCLEQIKDLRLPVVYDYEDYDYDDQVCYRDSLIDDDCYDPFD